MNTQRGAEEVPNVARTQEAVEIVYGGSPNTHTAIFRVPRGMEARLAKHTINARGAQFLIEVGTSPGTVQSTFYSSDPTATAEAIWARLNVRLEDPSPPGADECLIM